MSLIPYVPPSSAHRAAVCVLLAKLQNQLHHLGQADAAYRVRRLEVICTPVPRSGPFCHYHYDAQHVNGWTERALRSLGDVPHYLDPRGRTATDFNAVLDTIEQTQREIACQTK